MVDTVLMYHLSKWHTIDIITRYQVTIYACLTFSLPNGLYKNFIITFYKIIFYKFSLQ